MRGRCKKQIKKSAAFATDLLAGAEGLFLLARRSSVGTALPCQRARYSLPSYSRPSARSEKKNRLPLQPIYLAGAEGLFLLARRSSVRTALPCQRARYSLPSYSRPSARSKEKNRLLLQPTFLAGADGLFLLARRSSVRTALPCQGHGIHCRPILVLLQKANKKIGCFCNRPFWQGQKDSNPQQRFWRPTCYHYTIPLSTCSVYHESRFLSTGFLQDLARNCIKG